MPYGALALCSFLLLSWPICSICMLARSAPTTIGVLTYVQPIIAILYATFTGNDAMDAVKTLATVLVFVGVYLVTKRTTKEANLR